MAFFFSAFSALSFFASEPGFAPFLWPFFPLTSAGAVLATGSAGSAGSEPAGVAGAAGDFAPPALGSIFASDFAQTSAATTRAPAPALPGA